MASTEWYRRRSFRSWSAVFGNIFVPLVIEMSGLQGAKYVLLTRVGAAIWTLFCFWPDLKQLEFLPPPDSPNQGPLFLVLPGVACVLAICLGFWVFYRSVAHQPIGLTANEFAQPYLRGYSFRIYDLAGEDHYIRHRTFEDCWIYGPAIIAGIDGTIFNDNVFQAGHPASAKNIFLMVPDHTMMQGAVVLSACTFRRCHFMGIQVAGTEKQIKKWQQTMQLFPFDFYRAVPASTLLPPLEYYLGALLAFR